MKTDIRDIKNAVAKTRKKKKHEGPCHCYNSPYRIMYSDIHNGYIIQCMNCNSFVTDEVAKKISRPYKEPTTPLAFVGLAGLDQTMP